MKVPDLVFIACFLGAVIHVIWICWLLLRRRWPKVRANVVRLVIAVGVYFVILVAAGIFAPRRVLAANEILRYDDWCLGVEKSVAVETIGPEVRPVPGG